MNTAAKVTVAGAGALGLSCALALADAGCEVSVWDPAEPCANASGVAAGMLAPAFEAVLDPQAAPHFELLMTARNLWPALEARVGAAVDRSGALAAGRLEWLDGVAAGLTRLGLHATDLPRNAAVALAPGLSAAIDGVLLTREDWWLDARAALLRMRAAAQAAGVTFRAEALRRRSGDLTVIATGAARGLQHLAPELALLQPIKGHILRVACSGIGGVTVRGETVYATPTRNGLAVGATMEAGVADAVPDPDQARPLLEAGARLFPAMLGAPHELGAGVRGATPDGLPLVGWSRAPGVLLAAGARRNGWLLAPLVGRMVAAYATGQDPGAFAERLAPARFAP